MHEDAKTVRTAVLESVESLSRASSQLQYEKSVPIADVPAELICTFCDDLFHPKSQAFLDAFTESEVRDLAVLYGMLFMASRAMKDSHPLKVTDLHKLPEWRSVMAFAKELQASVGVTGR